MQAIEWINRIREHDRYCLFIFYQENSLEVIDLFAMNEMILNIIDCKFHLNLIVNMDSKYKIVYDKWKNKRIYVMIYPKTATKKIPIVLIF